MCHPADGHASTLPAWALDDGSGWVCRLQRGPVSCRAMPSDWWVDGGWVDEWMDDGACSSCAVAGAVRGPGRRCHFSIPCAPPPRAALWAPSGPHLGARGFPSSTPACCRHRWSVLEAAPQPQGGSLRKELAVLGASGHPTPRQGPLSQPPGGPPLPPCPRPGTPFRAPSAAASSVPLGPG